MPRLRQAVLAARDLDAAVDELRAALSLGEPYADPGVAYFGLRNAVMPLGDTFVEVVSPVQESTAAGRFLDRRGDGAYMAMFQVEDLIGARARAASLDVREVWAIELDDISAVHLHPADMGAAIVSLDRPVPPESWRWGGPWQPHGEARTAGLTLTARDPEALGARWPNRARRPRPRRRPGRGAAGRRGRHRRLPHQRPGGRGDHRGGRDLPLQVTRRLSRVEAGSRRSRRSPPRSSAGPSRALASPSRCSPA